MRWLALAAVVSIACGDAAPAPRYARPTDGRNEVIVVGTIHGRHRKSDAYSLGVLRHIIRELDPDYVLVEIPPASFPVARAEFDATGSISEPRVKIFPEYTDVLFPLSKDMRFEMVPCAAWSKGMADDRAAKLAEWKQTRPDDTRLVNEGMAWISKQAAKEGIGDRPRRMHTARYDAIVEQGLAPYNRLFNDDLGAGGWGNVNAAHMALIHQALDAHRGEGKRFVITFGAWHKHWFRRDLMSRTDVVVPRLYDVIE